MTKDKIILTRPCIESHQRMIKHHRKQIVELSRRLIKEPEVCNECFDFEIINESGRSDKV